MTTLYQIRPSDGARVYFNDYTTHAEGQYVRQANVDAFRRQAFENGFVGTPHPEYWMDD
jgi:hypothetical protein